jgi:hypothetical protein
VHVVRLHAYVLKKHLVVTGGQYVVLMCADIVNVLLLRASPAAVDYAEKAAPSSASCPLLVVQLLLLLPSPLLACNQLGLILRHSYVSTYAAPRQCGKEREAAASTVAVSSCTADVTKNHRLKQIIRLIGISASKQAMRAMTGSIVVSWGCWATAMNPR